MPLFAVEFHRAGPSKPGSLVASPPETWHRDPDGGPTRAARAPGSGGVRVVIVFRNSFPVESPAPSLSHV